MDSVVLQLKQLAMTMMLELSMNTTFEYNEHEYYKRIIDVGAILKKWNGSIDAYIIECVHNTLHDLEGVMDECKEDEDDTTEDELKWLLFNEFVNQLELYKIAFMYDEQYDQLADQFYSIIYPTYQSQIQEILNRHSPSKECDVNE
jgi:hypothetical protein